MAFIAGETFSGKFSELTVVYSTSASSSKSGERTGGHVVSRSAAVKTNVGMRVPEVPRRYLPKLAALLRMEV